MNAPRASKNAAVLDPVPEAVATPDPVLTGYVNTIVWFASRYKQGGRTVYSLDLSPEQIIASITKPDPEKPTPGNREIRRKHAEAFGRYIRERKNWVSPSFMLRTPKSFDFEVMNEVDGAQFGLLSIPRRNLGDLHIVDGQHRIFGFFDAADNIRNDLDKARSNLALARKNEGPKSASEREALGRIAVLDEQQSRLEAERVNVQIIVVEDPTEYKQLFFDIADNALGITASVRSRFDSQKVVNRALEEVQQHPLLTGRVDPERDRVSGNSLFWMGAKHVAEIVRSVNVGLEGRVSRRQEAEFSEKDFAAVAKDFLSVLTEAFPQMEAMTLGQISTSTLRKTSLLGSVLFVRVLGGVYHDLIKLHAFERSAVVDFFARLAPHLGGPTYEGDIWTSNLPEVFSPGTMAPRSRRQDMKALLLALTDWAITKPAFIDAEPAPRPVPEPEPVDVTEAAADEILRPETARARSAVAGK